MFEIIYFIIFILVIVVALRKLTKQEREKESRDEKERKRLTEVEKFWTISQCPKCNGELVEDPEFVDRWTDYVESGPWDPNRICLQCENVLIHPNRAHK